MAQDLFNYYKHALSNGLCSEYKGRWRACHDNKEQLVKLVMAQQSLPHFIHYCYNGMGLSKEYIQETFGDYINGNKVINDADGVDGYTYEMWVGVSDFFIKPQTDVSAYMWANNMTLRINETKCPTIYIGCGSYIKISPEGYNSIHIYLFDDSKVVIDDWGDETTKVVIYRYSTDAQVELGKYCLANVKVFDKQLKL
jgi:hypothetical protein